MAAQFDTSGAVWVDPAECPGIGWLWSDLSPFAQGYVEALFASAWADEDELIADLIGAFDGPAGMFDERGERGPQFTDLSPEALAMILADCASMEAIATGFGVKKIDAAKGRNFWNGRQAFGGYRLTSVTSVAFPPLRVFLNDTGKVCLSAPETPTPGDQSASAGSDASVVEREGSQGAHPHPSAGEPIQRRSPRCQKVRT